MGVVDKVGPAVTNVQTGDRVVCSFQVACGECKFCQKKLSSFCDRTNNSSLMQTMYGQRDAGFLCVLPPDASFVASARATLLLWPALSPLTRARD